jgi:hypothetical protein
VKKAKQNKKIHYQMNKIITVILSLPQTGSKVSVQPQLALQLM